MPLFLPNAVRLKVKNSYEEYTNFKRGRVNKRVRNSGFTTRLDKLYNICSCTCKFTSHLDTCEEGCTEIHIDCRCGRDKIPVTELAFIKDQRDKEGPTGKYQLGSVDTVHEKKRKRAASRLVSKSNKEVKSAELDESMSRLTSTSSEDSSEHSADATYEPDVFHSDHIDLENLAREADRYNSSDRSIAAQTTAFLIDLKIVTKNNTSAVITRKMVRAARIKYRSSVKVLSDEPIKAVYCDGKKDDTCTKTEDESGTVRYSKIKEEHVVLTSEPDGTYTTHKKKKKGIHYIYF